MLDFDKYLFSMQCWTSILLGSLLEIHLVLISQPKLVTVRVSSAEWHANHGPPLQRADMLFFCLPGDICGVGGLSSSSGSSSRCL